MHLPDADVAAVLRSLDALEAQYVLPGARALQRGVAPSPSPSSTPSGEETVTVPPIPVTLLVGLPASGQETVIRGLAQYASANRTWFMIANNLSQGLGLDPQRLHEDLTRVWGDAQGTSGSGRDPHVLLAVTGFSGVASVLRKVLKSPLVQAGRFHVRCVTASVRDVTFFERRTLPMPGALEQIQGGLVDNVILFGTDETRLQHVQVGRGAGAGAGQGPVGGHGRVLCWGEWRIAS